MHDDGTVSPETSCSEQLISLLARWEHEKEKGNVLTPETLCQDHPEFVAEVRERLKQLERSPLASDRTVDSEAPTIAPIARDDTEPGHTDITSNVLPSVPGFLLEGELGRGGMGVVYLARQIRLNRRVALKMIIAGDHANADARIRFLAEAEAIARLHHPGIVQVYEFGTHDNNPYFALEYLSGGSLDKKLAGTPLPPREAADLVEKLARAVQAAHDQGIIHRDLKPANILLDSPLPSAGEGSGVRGSVGFAPKITDFGLVKKAGSDMTATGQILGTPSYMAPEQADGKKNVGTTVDIYALGAILYECLTGRPPFKAATPLDTILQVVNDEPVSIRQMQAKTPADIETICMKCLQKDPAKRYVTAAALGDDLLRYLNHEPIHARPIGSMERAVKWVKRHRTLTIAAVSTAAALLIGLGLALWQAKVAKDAEQKAEDRADAIAKEKELTEEEKKKAQRLLALQANREGFRAMEAGDRFTGLLWFTQPLVLAGNQPEIERIARERLGVYRRVYKEDRLDMRQLLAHQGIVSHASYSSDSGRVVTASGDMTARVWDVSTGQALTPPMQHQKKVSHASFSPDGLRVVTASEDNTARVWDASTGQALTPPMLHQSGVLIASFSPDGNRIVTASGRTAQVWDAVSGEPVTPPLDHAGDVLHTSFSPDGYRIVTASAGGVGGPSDHTACVWDARSGKLITPLLVHTDWVSYATFSPDSRWVLTACYDKKARIWDAVTGQLIKQSFSHSNQLYYATFSSDGRRVVTASGDRTARVWDAISGDPVTPPLVHHDRVLHATFSPDGRRIVTASLDNTARMWNAVNGQAISPPLMHSSGITHALFSPDGRQIVTASNDKTARVWNIIALDLPRITIYTHENDVLHASFSLDDHYVVTASKDKTSRVWDSTGGQPHSPPLVHQDEVLHASFSPDQRRVVTASRDKTARVWDVVTGHPVSPPMLHQSSVSIASFSPDGRRVVTGSHETARVWDVVSSQSITQPLTHHGRLSVSYGSKAFVTFNTNGSRIVTSLGDGTAQVWDAESGRPVLPPLAHNEQVFHASFSPDGRFIVTASADNSARVWDAENGAIVIPSLPHQDKVFFATFSPNNRHIVTTSEDKTARVWDAISGKPVTTPLVHRNQVYSAAFSPDGLRLATVSFDWAVFVWDVTSGQLVTPPLMHGSDVKHACFSHDGRRLLTVSRNQAIIRELPLETRPTADLIKLAQIYAGHKIDDTGGLQPLDVEKELLPMYQEMKAKYPDEFIPKYEDTRRWRLKQIEDCCKERNLPAALFHQHWLLVEAVQEAGRKKQ